LTVHLVHHPLNISSYLTSELRIHAQIPEKSEH
jgi:hypothetical protein